MTFEAFRSDFGMKYFNQKNILLKITPLKVKFSLLKVEFEKKSLEYSY